MTEKQKMFCDEYLIDLNGTRAYKAVYKNIKTDNAAASRASKLLDQDDIKEYIDKRLGELANERTADIQEIMEYLTAVMRGESHSVVLAMCGDGCQKTIEKPPDEKERLKAAELIGRRYGMWSDKFEVKNKSEEQVNKSISNIENLVKQMVPIKDDEISE